MGGVSDFILNFLKDQNGSESRVIVEAYAKSVKKEPKQVYNNIANALSRLKSNGKLENREKEGGRSDWFLA